MAKRFGVSEMTIRRDFHGMEEQGLVTIHYGGASLRNTHSGFPRFGKKNLIRYNEVKDYQLILTDSELEEEIQKDFCKHGGHIQICG